MYCAKCCAPWQVVLTKCDLMSAEDVARSMTVVESDLRDLIRRNFDESGDRENGHSRDITSVNLGNTNSTRSRSPLIFPVSAHTGAGIQHLWRGLREQARRDTIVLKSDNNGEGDDEGEGDSAGLPAHAVREHRNASLLRRKDLLRRFKTRKTSV